MPIYEYKCSACGNEFEALVLPQSKGKPECPSCHSQDLEQLLSGFAVNSEERSQAVLKQARKKYVQGELRDKKIAEREDMERHHH
jgi:putative FmdB family regulatory protein